MENDTPFTQAFGIDVGSVRIGIARVGSIARLPSPVSTVKMSDTAIDEIGELAAQNDIDLLVVGLPQDADGKDTEQSVYSRDFAVKLETLGIPIVFRDETLSSKLAEHLIASGTYKRNEAGNQVGLDEVAACVILNDFLGEKSGF